MRVEFINRQQLLQNQETLVAWKFDTTESLHDQDCLATGIGLRKRSYYPCQISLDLINIHSFIIMKVSSNTNRQTRAILTTACHFSTGWKKSFFYQIRLGSNASYTSNIVRTVICAPDKQFQTIDTFVVDLTLVVGTISMNYIFISKVVSIVSENFSIVGLCKKPNPPVHSLRA